jgi:hypothetical protein
MACRVLAGNTQRLQRHGIKKKKKKKKKKEEEEETTTTTTTLVDPEGSHELPHGWGWGRWCLHVTDACSWFQGRVIGQCFHSL